MTRLTVHVVPRSSREKIIRVGDTAKVYLTAPPVDGAANEALLTLLARRLDLPRRALSIARGATSRQKVLEIEGLTAEQIEQRLYR